MKNFRILLQVIAVAIMAAAASCETEPKDPEHDAPVISFKNTTYIVKVGQTITIEPAVENDIDGEYSWTSEGKVLSTEKTLVYSWPESGQVYITFAVKTTYGSDTEEIRVDVAPLVPPVISLPVPDGGYKIATGQQLKLVPEVTGNDNSYLWLVDGEPATTPDREPVTTKDYIFNEDLSVSAGTFHISLRASNEDGEDSIEFDIHVREASEVEFSWRFESTVYNVSQGRRIRLLPYMITNAFDAEYIWSIDGQQVQRSPNPLFAFDAEAEGNHEVTVVMQNSYREVSQTLTVNVCPPEGTYRRSGTGSADWNRVYEYTAAPGQFINENYTAETPQQAATYAEERLRAGQFVSLGACGGYIVLGFDHSITNSGSYDFQIKGNSHASSSEPGIVWVMQDENGDGLPNDTWYELRGSEYGKPETIQDYWITYYRPSGPKMPVQWHDSLGEWGSVDYMQAFHKQDYYYPLWIESDSYTLRGTRLSPRTREEPPGQWVNDYFEWGYADNFSPVDRLSDDENTGAEANANHFKISNAVTFDGRAADLQYIDFIKIQTAVNYKAGWVGENSTEISGARDFNM